MIEEMITLASYGSFGSGAIGNLFAQWEAAGIFDYMLPFLLIFALVFGLLMKLNIFTSGSGANKTPMKGINAIIALAVALMAMQFNVASVFFSEIFPRFGIALSIILIVLILGGIFIPTNKKSNWFMVTLIIIVFGIIILVVYNSFNALGYGLGGSFSYFWRQYWPILIFAIIIVAIILSTSKKDAERPRVSNMLSKMLGEEND